MEAVLVAASAAAAATKEIALSASVAAAAADAKEAAAALNAKEAAAIAATALEAASAAALSAKKAAAVAATARQAASAAALDAKEAADVLAAATAAMQASKKRKFDLIDDGRSVDLFGRLSDDELGIIVSLLPTKEGARTQVISRRWRPIWRSAPLNLVANDELKSKGHTAIHLITKILSEHLGTARRFSLCLRISECYGKMEGWLKQLKKLEGQDGLEELELNYDLWFADKKKNYLFPSSTYHFAPKLRVAKFGGCHFPNLPPALEFPCLKQLTLESVTISEDALQSMLSGCSALESLELMTNFGFRRLCISSQTLKSLGFCTHSRKGSVILEELVIENTPSLERFLQLHPMFFLPAIWIISAPKLKILGMLSEDIPELHFGTTFFRKWHAVSLTTKIPTIRVLVLDSRGPDLDTVVNFLKCFPCLERLYVIFHSGLLMDNIRKYDPLDPIECLELHLKKVVLKNYDGSKNPSIDFTKFLVLNAKVLKEMKITLPYHRQEKWFANQHSLLQIRNRASKDAKIELKCGSTDNFRDNKHTHDLSMDDPFDIPSRECYTCSCGPF